MSNELDPIMNALRSAEMSIEASRHAIRSVRQMLEMVETEEPVQEDVQVVQTEEPVLEEGCQHLEGMEVNTMSGSYFLCHCGEQVEK